MIASIRGIIRSIDMDSVVIDAGGVGYRVYAIPSDLGTLTRNEEGFLLTTMIVRDDAWTLFGFSKAETQELFSLLRTVSGVGPRLAMSILSTDTPDGLSRALASSDVAALQRVPGVGKRLAERLVVDLKDKVKDLVGTTPLNNIGVRMDVHIRTEVIAALTSLGFATTQAELAVSSVFAQEPGLTTQVALKRALLALGGHE